MYDLCRPGVNAAKAVFKAGIAANLFWNSSGILSFKCKSHSNDFKRICKENRSQSYEQWVKKTKKDELERWVECTGKWSCCYSTIPDFLDLCWNKVISYLVIRHKLDSSIRKNPQQRRCMTLIKSIHPWSLPYIHQSPYCSPDTPAVLFKLWIPSLK